MREKAELGYKPRWEGPVQDWSRKYLYKHKWRVDQINDIRDLMQDAFILYLKVVDYYPGVREECHFISLYQTALRNYVTECSRKMRDCKAVLVEGEFDSPDYSNWGYVSVAVAKASEYLKEDIKEAMKELKEVLS